MITLIRPSHGYRLVNEMSLLSSLSFKKVTLTKLVNVNVNVNVADMIKDARKVSGIMYLNTMFCKDRYQISSRSGYVSYINYEREEVSTILGKH